MELPQRASKARKVCCNDVNDCADFEFVRDCSHPVQGEAARMSVLPVELVAHIMRFCSPESLLALNATSTQFRAFDMGSGLRLVEKAAKSSVSAAAGEQAGRWR